MHIDRYRRQYGEHFDYVDEEDCHYEDAESFLASKILGFCGCGDNMAALRYVRDVMVLIDNIYTTAPEKGSYKAAYAALDNFFGSNAGLQYTIYYLLDMKDLTEHGGSVPGWLTQKGKELVDDINALCLVKEVLI